MSAARLVFKNLLFTVLVPGTAAVYVPLLILGPEGRSLSPPLEPLQLLGLPVLAMGLGIYAWCLWDFAASGRGTPAPVDPPKVLVARGLYRYTRNPMYLGVLTVVVGEALLFRTPRLLAYAAGLLALFHLFVVLYEEPTLRRQFGAAYEDYRSRVPRWLLPRRRGPL